MDLYRTQDLVEQMLYTYPDTRNSDTELYIRVLETIKPDASKMPLEVVLRNTKALGLPKLESVGRARRKLQHNCPELRAVDEVVDGRYEEFKRYRDYAIN